jgi:type I restriction enzyme, S subunit
MSSTWPRVPLGEVLAHRKEFIEINDLETYKRCRVQLHAQGIVLRDQVSGAEIKTKQQQVCRAGEFLVAEIDAKLGGYGIVPNDLEGAIVSSHYFLFGINEEKLLRSLLGYFIRTPAFFEQVAAQGSTNYAAIRPGHVLDYTIPLPPLDEQRRLVERLDALAAKIEEAMSHRSVSSLATEAMLKSARRRLLGDSPTPMWIRLHNIVQEIENGWSPPCEKRRAVDGEWAILKVGAVSFGQFDPQENKVLPVGLAPKPEYEVKAGDFLMSRANTYDLVGACAVVASTPPRLMLSDKHFRFIFRNPKAVDLRYLDHVLKSQALRMQIVAGATGTSPTMKNISKEKVLNLLIPNHDFEEQQRLARELDSIQNQTRALADLQKVTTRELDAMLPAILDRAFRGEL